MSSSSFAASSAKQYITSLAGARARFAAGVKTAHALFPSLGFGNTVHPDGTCTTDPALPFIYTKKTVSIDWSYSGQPWVESPPIDEIPPNPHAHENYSPPRVSYIGEPDYDGSYAPEPTAIISTASSTTRTYQYYQYFDVSGSAIAPHYVESGDVLVQPTFDQYYSPLGNGWNNTTLVPDPYLWPVYLPTSASYTQSLAGTTATTTFSGNNFLTVGWYHYEIGDYTNDGPGGSIINISTFCNNWLGQEIGSFTITTDYSVPVSLTDLQSQSLSMLNQVDLHNINERYFYFDQSIPIQLNWNPMTPAFGGGGGGIGGMNNNYYVNRAELITGSLSSYTRLSSPFVNTYTDTTAIRGHTYYYRISFDQYIGGFPSTAESSPSSPLVITVTAPSYPITGITPTFSASRITPIGNVIENLTAYFIPSALSYTTFANALNSNQQLVLIPIDLTPNFVVSSNVSCAINNAVFLCANGQPLGSPVHIGVTGASGQVFSKSRGYLTNFTTASLQKKFNFQPKSGSVADVTTALTNVAVGQQSLTFPYSSSQSWQLTRELPAQNEAFSPVNLSSAGYLYWN